MEVQMKRKTNRDIAKDAGISAPQLCNILHRRRKATVEIALAIHEASEGRIKAYHLIPNIKDTISKGLKLLW